MKRTRNAYDLEKQNLRRDQRFNPLFDVLTNEFDNAFKEKNLSDEFILNHYYVDIREDISVTNGGIFQHFPTGISPVKNCSDLNKQIVEKSGMVFLLIGKKGIGKTTILKYYLYKIKDNILYNKESKSIVIYLDLRDRHSDPQFLSSLPESLIKEIYDKIYFKIPDIAKYFYIPSYIRLMHPSLEGDDDQTLKERFRNDKEDALNHLFHYLDANGFELTLIIDNIDDFGVAYVPKIIDKCRYMKNQYNAKCIIAVRDHWTPKNLGVADDSKLCSLHLCRPNIKEIVKKRLESINKNAISNIVIIGYGGSRTIELDKNDLLETFNSIIQDLLENEPNIQNELYRLANYDLREYLENIYHFFHSPYLFSRPIFIDSLSRKIKELDNEFHAGSRRKSKFFDFLESFMSPHALCYDSTNSNIFNIFHHEYDEYNEGYNYRNTLIFYRVLQLASEKKINKEEMLNKLALVGYDNKAIINAITILLNKSLLESLEGRCYGDISELTISDKGMIYLTRLAKEFSYLLFICDDVPMPDQYKTDILEKFGDEYIPLERGNLSKKFESVEGFLAFLRTEEQNEAKSCPTEYRWILDNEIKGGRSLSEDATQSIYDIMQKMKSAPTKRRSMKITKIKKRDIQQ